MKILCAVCNKEVNANKILRRSKDRFNRYLISDHSVGFLKDMCRSSGKVMRINKNCFGWN